MDNVSTRFTKKIYALSTAEMPERVLDKARECFIDYIACVLGGCRKYEKINMEFIKRNKLSGENHIFSIGSVLAKADLKTTVMINAFNAHLLELDDSHRVAMTHLGAPIFSALIGVAELYECNLEQMFKAAVVGYETAIRLANAVQPNHKKKGFHVSGTCCTVGCAMAIAAMLRYSQEEMQNVLSAAVTSAAGLLAVISGKSEQKPYNIANATVAGVDAALYGKYFNGAVDILGDSRGFFHAMTDNAVEERLFDEGYAIEQIYQKLYAACRHCHAPMEAALKIRRDSKIDIKNIDSIEVRTYDLAINGHDHTEITGVSSAKQSVPYGVAVALLYGECGMQAFTEEKIKNKCLLDLIKKIRVVEDKELTDLVPAKRAATVIVHLCNRKDISYRVEYAKGEPENPITKEELLKKFKELAGSAGLNNEKVQNLYNFLQDCNHATVKQLFQYLQ